MGPVAPGIDLIAGLGPVVWRPFSAKLSPYGDHDQNASRFQLSAHGFQSWLVRAITFRVRSKEMDIDARA